MLIFGWVRICLGVGTHSKHKGISNISKMDEIFYVYKIFLWLDFTLVKWTAVVMAF